MTTPENNNEDLYTSEDLLVIEPEADEADTEGENLIYLWLCLLLVVILVLSYAIV